MTNWYFVSTFYCKSTTLEGAIKALLEKSAAVEAVDLDGRTRLHFAALECHKGVVRVLIDRGAAIAVLDKDGYAPIQLPAQKGHGRVVQALLEASS